MKINQYTFRILKDEFRRLFYISAGLFLFILFFQPFPLEMLDFNNRLLYVTGFGGIGFLIACVCFIIIPLLLPKWFSIEDWEYGPPYSLNFLFLILTGTSFVFYIFFVGKTGLSMYIIFKVVLVCLIPLIILIILYRNKSLERIIAGLREQVSVYLQKVREFESVTEEEEIEIQSANKSENLFLKSSQIMAVKSADNYIEIYYAEADSVEKKLVRGTLKNIEQSLSMHRNFIRCHRTSLVNSEYIQKLNRDYHGYSLKLKDLNELIPVSRQYLPQVRKILAFIK